MTAFVGRLLSITRVGTGDGPALISGKMTKTITLNNGEIDITSDDDDGYRTLLAQTGVRSVDISMEGVLKNDDLLSILTDGPIQGNYSVDFNDLGTLTGLFQFTDIEVSGEHSGYVSFSCTMKSTGEFTYVPDAT